MISHIAIALLLIVSAVLGAVPSCGDLQETLILAGKLSLGKNAATIQSDNFENSVDFVRYSNNKPTVQKHIYSVQTSEENLPQVTVKGALYKIDSIATTILDQTMTTAVLAATFTSDESVEPSKEAVFLVPLIAVVENDPNLNAVLNSILHNLGTTPEKGIYKDTFQWLEPLLSNVASYTSSAKQDVTVFLTDCQNVVIDQHLMPAF